MAFIITILAIAAVLFCNELWWRHHGLHTEWSRKFVHITVGSFVAFWPFFLSWNQIRWLSLGFLVVVGISKYFRLFQAIHSVQRPTWGEAYFALAVGLATFVTHDKWIYMAALLQMSLADGLAAVVGVRYAKQSYLVFGHRKSWLGSLAFFIVSLTVLVTYTQLTNMAITPLMVVGVAGLATIIENLGVRGLDNLFVPLLVAGLLSIL